MSTESLFAIFAVLLSSFWGSWHCAAMCGPIASLAAHRNSLWHYHLGKGLTYTLLGALSGYLGSFLLSNDFYLIRTIAGFVFAGILVFMGIQSFRGIQNFRPAQFSWIHSRYTRKTPGFVLGALSIFLPCGWLYTYIFASAATRSSWSGALLMLLFWMAGIPALSAISIYMKKSIQVAPRKKQLIAGLVLTIAGIYSLTSFFYF
jgi:uncharacterized protein